MKHQLELIEQEKKKSLQKFRKIRNKYIACVYDGLIKNKSVSEIHKDIRKISKVFYQKNVFSIENYSFKLIQKVKSKKLDADLIFVEFNRLKVYEETNKIGYEEAKRIEGIQKDEVLKQEILSNRKAINAKIFYLCSSHNDCAIDHINYQGKIYVDEKWKNFIKDENLRIQIDEYIQKNNIQTLQYITFRPIWLITRPNCRHYFESISTEEVLKKSVSTLLQNYKMHSYVGQKPTQTLKHPTNKEWYKVENVENIIKKYEDRLEFHKSLWERDKKTQILRNAVEKDKFLIQKWKDYLKKLK